jgi:hypothetical protein
MFLALLGAPVISVIVSRAAPTTPRTRFGTKGIEDVLIAKIYHQFWFPYSELTRPVVVLRRLGLAPANQPAPLPLLSP